MAELYTNLNTVTLYKTPKFNKIDSVMFSSKTARDNYFNSFTGTDKIEMTEFTDLFEGRSLVLPYNYLDLKQYNTMKLYYNDGLGHEETYYCNVDNYIYISTDACFPIYRIDYFLTYSYMLYDKTIDIVTDRRTVSESGLNKNMKADGEVVPRLKYEKTPTYFVAPSETVNSPYYIVYLNKTTGGVGKLGINCKMQIKLQSSPSTTYDIDTYTIGCYVAIADKDHLSSIIGNEPLEYIEKIIEVDTPVGYIHTSDYTNLTSNGYVYLNNDITLANKNSDSYYYGKVNLYNESTINKYDDIGNFSTADRTNIYPNHKKKILNWQPTRGIVIQGQEFDLKDFNDADFPTVSGVTNFNFLYSTIYFFNFLGYTFAYPLGYKHEAVNLDYMIKWQSGRNFEYSSEYVNSLAYKELQEYNTQAVKYAKQQAGIQANYNSKVLANAKEALDITKNQTAKSYENQFNSLSTEINNIYAQYFSTGAVVQSALQQYNPFGNLKSLISGGNLDFLQQGITRDVANNNISLLRNQRSILYDQLNLDIKSLQNQYNKLVIDSMYQNDCVAIARDNTIANVSISNKYNNSKPNAYYETDFTQFSSYYYIYYIDLTDGDMIEQNIKNRYNVLGTYVGYLEKWQPSSYEGLYFDYIKGSVVNNSYDVSKNIPNEIYIELISRIEEGIRIWHENQLDWFGNLTIDNTNLGTAEPYNTYSESDKADLQSDFDTCVYVEYRTPTNTKSRLITLHPEMTVSYINWFVDNQPWGSATIPADRQSKILTYETFIWYDHTTEETKQILIDADFLTIYEKQWILPQVA